MKDEIKEILECLSLITRNEYVSDELLNDEMCQQLLDYITNLQKENERLKEIINQAIVLVNYINNLQDRIDNAIEYIEENIDNGNELVFTQKGKWTTFQFRADNSILKILKGE